MVTNKNKTWFHHGVKRYDKSRVKNLKKARRLKTPSKGKLSPKHFQKVLGELKGAGHLKFTGGSSQIKRYGIDKNSARYEVQFNSFIKEHSVGEQPHIKGYLESANDVDREPYEVRGWFNSNGTIRLEIVEKESNE